MRPQYECTDIDNRFLSIKSTSYPLCTQLIINKHSLTKIRLTVKYIYI